jgi:hypothetical protein
MTTKKVVKKKWCQSLSKMTNSPKKIKELWGKALREKRVWEPKKHNSKCKKTIYIGNNKIQFYFYCKENDINPNVAEYVNFRCALEALRGINPESITVKLLCNYSDLSSKHEEESLSNILHFLRSRNIKIINDNEKPPKTLCHSCGVTLIRRAGTCYICQFCGETQGCG